MIMMNLLFFILGLLIGGLIAITFMCCLQINRINNFKENKLRKETLNEK